MVKKIVMCVGDSTSLPGHTNTFEDTWFYKLSDSFDNLRFVSVFRRGVTTEILVTEGGGDKVDNLPKGADCLEFYTPSVVIIQLGIVDCAPRLLTIFDKVVLKLLPKNKYSLYLKLVKRFRKRKKTNTLVKKDKFKNNIESYLLRCKTNSVEKVFLISIPYPDYRMIEKNALIEDNINAYNEVIDQISEKYDFVEVINVLDARKYQYVIYEDGYHPNVVGNALVYKELKNRFVRYNSFVSNS